MKNGFHRLRNLTAAIVLVQILASCSSSGNGNTSLPPAQEIGTLQEVGKPYDPNTVLAPVCANPLDPAKLGPAPGARYPKTTNVFRGWPSPPPFGGTMPLDYYVPLQLRSDRAGGFVVSHYTDLNGAMFQVSANGDKSPLPLPYASVFDVAADGGIWFVSNGMLSVGTKGGGVTNLAREQGTPPFADGPLGSTPLGPVSLIAAGRDKVYLLIEEGKVNLGTPVSSSLSRNLRMLTRTTQGGWTVQTIPLFSDLLGIDVISAMRVGPSDELVLLLNQPFKQLVSQQAVWPGASQLQYAAVASVRIFDATGNWAQLGSKPYSLSVTPNSTHGYLNYSYSLDAKDLSVDPNGGVWVGGAGAIYSVDSTNGWKLVASPFQYSSDYVGRDGPIATASFANAGQIVADHAGLTFYDGETCQIRRLQDGQMTTTSGPVLSGPSFAGAGFIGLDSAGALLFAYENSTDNSTDSYYQTLVGRYRSLFALAKASVGNPLFTPISVKSLAGAVGDPICRVGTSYWAGMASCVGAPPASADATGSWLGQSALGPIARIGSNIYSGLDAGSGAVVGSTLNWPGILNGDAPSGPSGIHVDGNNLFMFGTMRTNPPIDLSASKYHEVRLYQLDLITGTASPLAGKSIGSAAYSGHKVDLSPIIPTVGGGPALVQHRNDGKFWLSNGKEIWLLDGEGQLSRVAGLTTSGGSGIDGIGDAASFALISSIRVLPDNRLLVVDQGAHAIRLVTDDSNVVTIIGRLNQPGQVIGPLPAGLDSPLDAYAVGGDIYISTQTSRNVLLARKAF